MPAPKATMVPPNVATVVYPALTGLSLSGTVKVYTAQPGWFGNSTVLDDTNGFPYQGNFDEFPPTITLLGQVGALYFYHDQPSPVEVRVWVP
jgi:hypothetical protein